MRTKNNFPALIALLMAAILLSGCLRTATPKMVIPQMPEQTIMMAKEIQKQFCTPGEKKCYDDNWLEECNGEGTKWVPEKCEHGCNYNSLACMPEPDGPDKK